MARPKPPATITPASRDLAFSASASSMAGRLRLGTAQIASEHQAVERRIFDAMIDVRAQHREQLLARTAEARDLAGHALGQHLKPRG